MTPESPQSNPEKGKDELTRRAFLAGGAAMAVGFTPERAEAAMSPAEFEQFLATIEGAEPFLESVLADYRQESEAMRYLMQRQFTKCHPEETPIMTGYDGPGRMYIDCQKGR